MNARPALHAQVRTMTAGLTPAAFRALLGGFGTDDAPVPYRGLLLWPGLPLTGTIYAPADGHAPAFTGLVAIQRLHIPEGTPAEIAAPTEATLAADLFTNLVDVCPSAVVLPAAAGPMDPRLDDLDTANARRAWRGVCVAAPLADIEQAVKNSALTTWLSVLHSCVATEEPITRGAPGAVA